MYDIDIHFSRVRYVSLYARIRRNIFTSRESYVAKENKIIRSIFFGNRTIVPSVVSFTQPLAEAAYVLYTHTQVHNNPLHRRPASSRAIIFAYAGHVPFKKFSPSSATVRACNKRETRWSFSRPDGMAAKGTVDFSPKITRWTAARARMPSVRYEKFRKNLCACVCVCIEWTGGGQRSIIF